MGVWGSCAHRPDTLGNSQEGSWVWGVTRASATWPVLPQRAASCPGASPAVMGTGSRACGRQGGRAGGLSTSCWGLGPPGWLLGPKGAWLSFQKEFPSCSPKVSYWTWNLLKAMVFRHLLVPASSLLPGGQAQCGGDCNPIPGWKLLASSSFPSFWELRCLSRGLEDVDECVGSEPPSALALCPGRYRWPPSAFPFITSSVLLGAPS